MGTDLIINVILPASLGIIMFGMGTSLVLDDFKRILVFPKAIAVGALGQIVLLPLLGFLFCLLFELPPEMAVGVMILVACAGGAVSNMVVYLARGDVALSVTLTAISCCITVLSIPFIVNLALEHFMGATEESVLPVGETNIRLFLITLLPVWLGMSLRQFFPDIGAKLEKPVNHLATIIFVAIFVGIIFKEKDRLADLFESVGPLVVALNLTAMLVGGLLAKIFSLSDKQSVAISVEVGLQNSATGIFIATSLLGNMAFASVPAIYSLIMLFNAALFVAICRLLETRRNKAEVTETLTTSAISD